MKPPDSCAVFALRDCEGVADDVKDEYARFVPATGASAFRDA